MRKLTLTALLFLSINIGASNVNDDELADYNMNYFPLFLKDYEKVRQWEGNYAYLEYDKGGETYAGIARNFNRKWKGWRVIDRYKNWNRVEWNDSIPEAEPLVMEFYYDVWMRDKYYLIKDEFVRNYLFDYRNTGPIAYKHAKQVLRYHGIETDTDGYLDESTIRAINKINPIVFILHLREVRQEYYRSVVDRRPEMEIYLKGWIKRSNHINIIA